MIDGVETGKAPVLAGREPIVVGHEGAGVVEAVGPGVTTLRPGDRVVNSGILENSCGRGRAVRGELAPVVDRRREIRQCVAHPLTFGE